MWWMQQRWATLFVPLVLLSGCWRHSASEPPPATPPAFTEFTKDAGLVFNHDPGELNDFEMPQIMGSGAGLLDYDNDGRLDVLLIDGGPLVAPRDDASPAGPASRLFRQQEDGTFDDVTNSAGLTHVGYGMGLAVGDIDNDGDVDIYFSNYGPDQLFANNGDGTFTDITQSAGIHNPQWGTAVSFVDYDNDGWLDLFVVNYVDFLPGSICEDGTGRRDFCGPEAFTGTVDKLYRNRGADTSGPRFEDVTVAAGITAHAGKGLGLMCSDVNADGRPDFYVANDMEDNCLWIQQPDGTFTNEAHLRGVAVNQLGEPEASMGVAWGDLDEDSYADILLTHLSGETNTFYSGDATGVFLDASIRSGLGPPSRPFTGFGVVAMDLEHDGDLDVVVANGRVKRGPPAAKTDTVEFWREYAEPNHIYWNRGEGKFEREESTAALAFSGRVEVSRALAYGDIDEDGDLDLLLANCGGPARLYRNDVPKQGHWLLVRAVDPELKRDVYGARITLAAGDRQWVREVNPSSSYLSSHDVRVHFGIGPAERFERITVQWPGASEPEEFPGGAVDRMLVLTRGTGTAAGAAAAGTGDAP